MTEAARPQNLTETLLWTPEPTGGEALVYSLRVRLFAGEAWHHLQWTGPAYYREVRQILDARPNSPDQTGEWTRRANEILGRWPAGIKWLSKLSSEQLEELREGDLWDDLVAVTADVWKDLQQS